MRGRERGRGPQDATARIPAGGGGAGEGLGLNHRRHRHTTKGRGSEAGAGGSTADPAPPALAAVGAREPRVPRRGRGGRSPRPPAQGGHGPAPGAARAACLLLPSPSAPGRETFASCFGPRQGMRARGARPRALGRPPPPATAGPSGRRGVGGPYRAAGSGGLCRGFEVPAASAPALRGGGAWWPPRMPLTALRCLAPPERRGRPAPGRGARAHALESPPSWKSGSPPPSFERCLGFVRCLGGPKARAVLGEGSV